MLASAAPSVAKMRKAAITHDARLVDRYKILGKIGEGTYGLVYKAELLHPKKGDEDMTFAVKMVKSHKEGKNDVVLSMATLREIRILRELKHDNVVLLHDVHVDPIERSLALVFEYAHHDLRDIIVQSKQKRLSEYTTKSLMYQILKGVKYMHDNWILHRDMKPQNILVVGHGRRRGQVKIADFGLARVYQSPIKALSDVERVVVTLWYRAPELLLGAKHYTKAVDIWATGCIFAELLQTRELFCGKEVEGPNAPFQKDQCDKIFRVLGVPTAATWPGVDRLPEYHNVKSMLGKKDYPSKPRLREAVQFSSGQRGERLCDLITKMLDMNPETRITAEESLNHPYFTQTDPAPRDWAFDEPGQQPVTFQMQNVVPVPESQMPGRGNTQQRRKRSHSNVGNPPPPPSSKRPHDSRRRDDRRR